MIYRPLLSLLLLTALCFGTATAAWAAEPGDAAAADTYDDDAPDEDFVYEDGDELEDGTVVEGFYRLRARPNHKWVAAHYKGGKYVRGHWRYVGAKKPGMVWVPGHLGADGYWVVGHWRTTARKGFVWVPGHRNRVGAWVRGHWKPAAAAPGKVWVAGHRNVAGAWVPGHWRVASRDGFKWAPGHWRYGRFVRGHWAPTTVKANHVWVAGHYGPKGWVPGHWRVNSRPGHYWRPARWVKGAWTAGAWAAGARPVLKRRYRVRPIRTVRASRVHNRRLWRNGKAQVRKGKVQERRGKKVEKLGEATGNKRLEKKGERMQKKGKKNQRRGKTKKAVAR